MIYRKVFLIPLLFAHCCRGSKQALGAAADEIAPGGPIQEQNQGGRYGTLLDLPYEMLIHIGQYLDFESLKNLMGTNKTFHTLGKDPQVQNALKIREAQELLSRISRLEPAELYTAVSINEIEAAAKEGREPGYLPMIHKAYGIRLREFLGGIPVGESREERIRHGINLISLMSAALEAAWYADKSAARHAVRYAARYVAWKAARRASLATARNIALSAAGDASGSAAREAALSVAGDATFDVTRDAIKTFLATTKNLSHPEKGRLTYRATEVSALLYVLKFALDDPSYGMEGVFSRFYRASDEVLKRDGLPEDLSIWKSQEAWDAFYTKHFGKLTKDPLAFLTPYLDEINKTRLAILNLQS